MRKVLNVGGNSKTIPLPQQYAGWEHVLLDIDPKGKPDVVCDARELSSLPGAEYDSVYCAHNLEHYYHHEVAKVLAGFSHVLKADGFVFIRVPDMADLMRTVAKNNLDMDDVLYEAKAGPITVRDFIYGYGKEIEESGNDFFAHKTGFTRKSLILTLRAAGFPIVFTATRNLESGLDSMEVVAFAFKNSPNKYAIKLLGLPKN